MSTPHPVDLHVGNRLREFRIERGWSQTDLAEKVGVSYPQIRKYEVAINRISASKLFELAVALEVTIMDFYDGLPLI